MRPMSHWYSTEILVVDDVPAALDLLTGMLREAGYSARAAISGELALQSAFLYPPALVILDVRMHGIDGFEVCRRLKDDSRTAHIPVIFVSGLSDVADRVRGFEAGGVDFITKPVRREEVLARVHAQMALRQAMEEINEYNKTLETRIAQRTADLVRERNTAQNYLDIAGVALFALDCIGNVVMMNKKGQEIFAVSEHDILGVNWFESFIRGPHKNDLMQRYSDLISKNKSEKDQKFYEVFNKKGEKILISCSTKLLRDANENVSGTLSSAEDVTERLRTQKALKQSEEKYRSYVENAPDAIFISDAGGSYLDANPAACELLMFSRTELLGKKVGDLAPPGERPAHLELNIDVARHKSRNTELRLLRKDGTEILASVKSVQLTDHRVMWFCSDISELRRAEFQAVARARELDEALKQLHSLTAHMHDSIEKERLVTATDIHDQIGALLTGAKLLLNQVNSVTPELPRGAKDLLVEVSAIVGQALTSSRGVYARLRPPMLDDLGLVETVRWYLRDWEQKTGIKERHYLAKLASEPNKSLRMDTFRILQELLTNVARHSGATEIHVRLHAGKGGLVLRVCDNGRGFESKIAPPGFGLQGIRGRLNRYGGTMKVDPLFPGVSLTAVIPMTV